MSNLANQDPHAYYVAYLEALWNYFSVTAMKTRTLSAYSDHLTEDSSVIESFPIAPILQESLQVDCVLTITKLTEENRSEKNIPKFLNFTESNWEKIRWSERSGRGKLTPKKVKEQREGLEKISDILLGFMRQRDKYFAHYDNDYFFNPYKLFEDYPNINKDLYKVMGTIEGILREHQLYLNSSFKISPAIYSYDYVVHHLELMKKAQEEWDKQKVK